jgi:hypothetical protein
MEESLSSDWRFGCADWGKGNGIRRAKGLREVEESLSSDWHFGCCAGWGNGNGIHRAKGLREVEESLSGDWHFGCCADWGNGNGIHRAKGARIGKMITPRAIVNPWSGVRRGRLVPRLCESRRAGRAPPLQEQRRVGCRTTQRLCTELLIAEGNHGIDAHGATRGDVAGEQGDNEKHSGNGGESERIAGADAVEEARHQPRQSKGRKQTDYDAYEREAGSMREDQTHDVTPLRAKRDANADLVGLLRDGVGEDAINSNRRQKKRSDGENPQERRVEPWPWPDRGRGNEFGL